MGTTFLTPCEPLERRTLLSTAAGTTIYSGVYSLNTEKLDITASNLDTTNQLIKFGTTDVYEVFTANNGGVTTYDDAASRNALIEAGMHRLLQFDLVTTRVYDSNTYTGKYDTKTIWLLNQNYLVFDGNRSDFGGTAGDDRVSVFTRDGSLVVSLNGVESTTTSRELRISGIGGDDKIVIDLPDDFADVKITLDGGDGNDTLWGGVGAERIYGGDGDDLINGNGGKDTIYAEAGNDFLRGGGSSDLLDGGEGYDTLFGDAGNDNISGGANPDRLRGGDGNDTLRGNGGRDILAGEVGDDELFGMAGSDIFSGGGGADRFADVSIIDGDQTDYFEGEDYAQA